MCIPKNIILTPNQMEFTRLWNEVMKEKKSPAELTPSSESSMFVKTLAATLRTKNDSLPENPVTPAALLSQKAAVYDRQKVSRT